jgi:hydrogenase maturation protease
MKTKPRLLIIGIGNEYRRDDAAGLFVARRLKKELPEEVTILEYSGEGAVLLETLQQAEAVILVDAVSSGAAAGTIYHLDARTETVPAEFFNYSTHAFSIAEAVELARALNQLPQRLTIYGIEGKNFAAGLGLSTAVQEAANKVVERIAVEYFREHFTPAVRGAISEGARLDITVRPDTAARPAQEIILDGVKIDEWT